MDFNQNLNIPKLGECCEIEVYVDDNGNFFTGKVYFSAERIRVKITGEEYGDRKIKVFDKRLIERAKCIDPKRRKLLLFNLRLVSRIRRENHRFIFFENIFDAEYAIYCHSPLVQENAMSQIQTLCIQSEYIAKWIGNTEKQEEILQEFSGKIPSRWDGDGAIEFKVDIGNKDILKLFYSISKHYSSPEFNCTLNFPPVLRFSLRKSIEDRHLDIYIDKICNLFNFLIGDQVLFDEVKLKDSNGIEGSFYLPSKKPHNKNTGTNILFPLGKDLRFQQFKLPPTLPYQDIFKAYFSFDKKELEFFRKFIVYKSMSNLEDKFLGYFRILEALTYKRKEILDGDRLKEIAEKAKPYLYKKFEVDGKKNVKMFVRGITRCNQKYNTEKCIQDLLLRIPNREKWQFQKEDIGAICKLRNNITHANYYYISEAELFSRVCFLEILLVFALGDRLEMPADIVAQFIHRSNVYKYILKKEYCWDTSF